MPPKGYDKLAVEEVSTAAGGGGGGGSIYAAGGPTPDELKRRAAQRAWLKLLCATLAVDVGCSALLYAVSDHDAPARAGTFTGDTADTASLALGRCAAVFVLVAIAITQGVPQQSSEAPHKRVAADRAKEARSAVWRRAALVGLFVFLTGCSVLTGIKCVVFSFVDDAEETRTAPFLALVIALTNIEFWLSKRLIASHAKAIGAISSHLHLHPLRYFPTGAPGAGGRGGRMGGGGMGGGGPGRRNVCDICRTNVSAKPAYHCADCRFNLCVECFETKSDTGEDEEENVVRGDKGKRAALELGNTSYFRRSLELAKPEASVIGVAFAALLAGTSANLILPNYQGIILDRVIAVDSLGFESAIKTYLLVSGFSGIFDALRQCCFMIVGRRVGFTTRNRLYTAMLRQDIAFFDGMTTGQLTSRIGQDSMQMIAPLRNALGTLLSASISLVGGLVMCLATSWKLSMLAFTSIFPVLTVTAVYAEWSSKLNREIFSALGDSMANATEALSNVRTVRSFSAEEMEERKFQTNTGIALRKGVKDAFGASSTSLLTNYVNLFAGVLILWYGGASVLHNEGGLTIGRLITFQLYWNMINNAYRQLNGIVVQFTTARGAATRVFEMMDSLPDVDLDAGQMISRDDIRGDIALRKVDFAYQMRSRSPVLRGIELEIGAGQVCALVGKSGGGKSTLVHLLMRFCKQRHLAFVISATRSHHRSIGTHR